MPNNWKVDDAVTSINDRTKEPVMGQIEFPMAPNSDVAGYGKFVSLKAAETMVSDYVEQNDFIEKTLLNVKNYLQQQLASSTDSQIEIQKLLTDIVSCNNMLDENQDYIAGTYGKELILSLLSRTGCEGLRYICCRYKGRNSIYLYPVGSDGTNKSFVEYYKQKTAGLPEPPPDPGGEVKVNGTTRGALRNRPIGFVDNIPEYIFTNKDNFI